MRTVCFAFSASLLILLPMATSGQDFSLMVQKVPDSANVLTLIDVAGLKKSNVAATEGWEQKRTLDYYAGKVSFPPTAKMMLLASQYSPAERRNQWQVGLTEYGTPIDMYVVAKKEGSEVDWIENVPTVPSRRNIYFLQFDRDSIGMFSPADRQQATRWVRMVKEGKPSMVSKYLLDSVQRGSEFGQIAIAFDLSNLMTQNEARERLLRSKMLEDAKPNMEALSKLLAHSKGVRLAIKVDNKYTGQLNIDFSENVEPYATVLQGLVIESLTNLGFSFSGMGNWQSETKGNSYILRGRLESDEVKRIMALVLPSMPATDREEDIPSDKKIAITSQRYWQAVNGLLSELRAKSDQYEKSKQYTNNALWHEAIARKIDQLPLVNTDEALQQYASRVAARLRIMAESLRGVDIQNKVLDSYQRTDQGYGYDLWGGYYGGYSSSNWREVASSKVESAAKGAKDRNLLWRQIGDDTTDIRRLMSDKYKIEF